MLFSKRIAIKLLALTLALLPSVLLAQDAHIGSVRTEFRMLGPNNTIEVERFDDPKVQGISCYISYSQIGGISGAVGLAEEASEASVACRQTGEIVFNPAEVEEQEVVFTQRRSALFKNMRVVRMHDAETETFVYLTYSTKLVDGSPKNAITAVHYGDLAPTQ
ncbi:MAG: CreA family protein [Halomonadaceae bacterium]|uniref:CreA family protein n=1 Tax=Halomonas colorata TaxID=2742615 RepID=A0ABR9FV78_9GAMM|nr:CreA family protein [Halomonas colorata]MBE0462551.1 CreA family protein [Halomonas colorata]